MADGEDRPPLPDTGDPFVLLGIDKDADERTVRKAYARLIKVWRPDRSPAEFERLHSAFEVIKEIRGAGVETIPTVLPAARATASEDSQRQEQRPPESELEQRLAACTAAERADLLASDQLTWQRLRAIEDRWAVRAILMTLVDTRLARDPARVTGFLGDPELFEDAKDEPALGATCLRSIAALSWFRHRDALALFERFRALPRHHAIDHLLDEVEHDLELARLVAASEAPLPGALLAYLRAAPLAEPLQQERAVAKLRQDLHDAPMRYLSELDAVAKVPELAEALTARLCPRVPVLAELPAPVFARLSRVLVGYGGGINPLVLVLVIFGFPIGLVLSDQLVLAAIVGGIGISLGAAYLATEQRRYRTAIRVELAEAIARVGVPAECVRQFLTINGKLVFRYARFDSSVDADVGLHLLGSVATHVRAEEDPPDDDLPAGEDG